MEPEQDPRAHISQVCASVESRCQRWAELIDSAQRRAREQRVSARATRLTARAMGVTARAMYERSERQFARSVWEAVRNDAIFGVDEQSRADVLQAALEKVRQIYPSCHSVGVTTVYGEEIRSLRYATVASSGTATRVDAAQYALDEGPCLDAVELDRVVVVGTDDLANDEYPAAWPRFTAVARDLGIRSVISVGIPWTSYWTGPLNPSHPPVGAINIYSNTPNRLLSKERQALALGVHVAARLTGADPDEIYDTTRLRTVE